MKTLFVLFFLIIFCAVSLKAQKKAIQYPYMYPDSTRVTISEDIPFAKVFSKDIQYATLDNGLQYSVLKNDVPEKKVVITFLVKVGRLDEKQDEIGYTHLLNKLLLSKIETLSEDAMKSFLKNMGFDQSKAQFTKIDLDYTLYSFHIDNDSEKIKKVLNFFKDLINQSSFDNDLIEGQKKQLLANTEQLKSNESYQMQKKLYNYTRYGSKHAENIFPNLETILSNANDINLLNFYKKWYTPAHCEIIVVGDINTQQTIQAINNSFKSLGPKVKAKKKNKYKIAHHTAPQILFFKNKNFRYNQGFQYNWKIYFENPKTFGGFLNNITMRVVIEMMKKRILQYKLSDDIDVQNIRFSGSQPLSQEVINFSFLVNLKKNNLDFSNPVKKIKEHLLKIKKFGFKDFELQGVLNELKLQATRRKEFNENKINTVNLSNAIFNLRLGNFTNLYPNSEYFVFEEVFKKNISLEDINSFTQSFLEKTSEVIFFLGDIDTFFPSERKVKELIQIDETALEYDLQEALYRPLLSDYITFGQLETETDHGNSVLEMKLKNGVRIIFKPTPFPALDPSKIINANEPRGKLFIVGQRNGGYKTLDNKLDRLSAILSGQVVAGSGLGAFSLSQLNSRLKDKSIFLKTSIQENIHSIEIDTAVADAIEVCQLIYLYFTQPQFKAEILETLIKTSIKNIEKQQQPFSQAKAYEKINDVITNGHFLKNKISKDIYKQLSINHVKKIYKDFFDSAHNFTFYITGDFDINKYKYLFANYLGALPAHEKIWKKRDVKKINLPKKSHKYQYEAKGMETSNIIHNFSMPLHENYNNILQISAGSYLLEERLKKRFQLEQIAFLKPKVVYSFFQSPDNFINLQISYQATMTHEEALLKLVNNEIQGFKNLIAQNEIDAFIEIYEKENNIDHTQPKGWLQRLLFYDKMKLPFKDILLVNKIDPKIINPENLRKFMFDILERPQQEFIIKPKL